MKFMQDWKTWTLESVSMDIVILIFNIEILKSLILQSFRNQIQVGLVYTTDLKLLHDI